MKFLFVCALMAIPALAQAGGGSSVGPANPATVACLDIGGKLEAVSTPQGEDANCAVEEWQLFREMSQRNLVQKHHYNGMVPNPAAVNCDDVGGTSRAVQDPAGESSICVVEQWTLWRVLNPSR